MATRKLIRERRKAVNASDRPGTVVCETLENDRFLSATLLITKHSRSKIADRYFGWLERLVSRANPLLLVVRELLRLIGETQASFGVDIESMLDTNSLQSNSGLTIEVDDKTRGFVTEKGGLTARAPILAHALGLPAVSGIGSLYQTTPIDSHILLDGDSGEVILNPSRETLVH